MQHSRDFVQWGCGRFKACVSTVGVWFYVGHACIGAKDNAYNAMVYNGPSSFVGAVKLIHTQGRQKKQEAYHKQFMN